MTEELAAYLHYTPLETLTGDASEGRIASLVINRQTAANSFSGELLTELARLLAEVEADPTVRLLLLQGKGKHFSAGADLNWMQAAARLDYAGNVKEAEKLLTMFEALANLRVPTLAVAKGAAFGGAVGLVAACDYAVAVENARFCLSEVKIGLLPAVILPYLARKMQPSALRRLMLTGKVFSAKEAEAAGLISETLAEAEIEAWLQNEVTSLLAASPEAQTKCKQLYRKLEADSWAQGEAAVEAIASTRASAMGQAGLGAFFAKVSPPWSLRIPAGEKLFIA